MHLVHNASPFQDTLLKSLQVILPNEKPHVNVRKQTQFKYAPDRTHYLELDIWYPKLNLCFEFQDNYHYWTTWYSQQSIAQIQHKDDVKRQHILQSGLNMISIPCWWDGNNDSLITTIAYYMPNVCNSSTRASPITLNPAMNFYQAPLEIPHIGELMYASFPLTEQFLGNEKWWLGEKYDGIRYCWNPITHKLYTRYANEVYLLPEFLAEFPAEFIDGELWFGRGNFALVAQLMKDITQLASWDSIRLLAFDCPSVTLQASPFEHRYAQLLSTIEVVNPLLIVVSRYLCCEPLAEIVQNIVDNGGEGVIVRQAGSLYEHGRSSSLVKLKSVYGDSEGIVVGMHQKLIYLQLSNGTTFSVPPENVFVSNLAIGDVVSFSYESHTRTNVLVNPKISRVRHDINWENSTSEFTIKNEHFGNMRIILEDFAAKRNLDPLVPNTWYSLMTSDLRQERKGKTVLKQFGSYVNAVVSLFPDIQFTRSRFKDLSSVGQRRAYFENYARQKGFDPLNPEHWYSHRSKILPVGKTPHIIYHHNNSVTKALLDLFPEIGLEKSKFLYVSSLTKKSNRRKFFEKYAKLRGFDALDPENWHSEPKNRILASKGALGVIWYHGNSVTQALLDLFPEIGLDRAKLERHMWTRKNRRLFFENFAKEKGFDPLVPNNWYNQSKAQIKALKGSTGVLAHHSNSVSKALIDLFPDIGLDFSRLKATIVWNKQKRRNFFETYAKTNGFDPLDPSSWHSQSQKQIMQLHGASSVLWYHNYSVPKAIVDLFPEVEFDKSKLIYDMSARI